ncbi:conserved hypothetical protein [Trichinella spiralis]|uniref:hypothetical protein n=1 Tax=Trichinella spiralis TaxID=6334 RepID=UPI0001EFB6A6|nr:conserved hypothetical protein [Trichinella spiralis]
MKQPREHELSEQTGLHNPFKQLSHQLNQSMKSVAYASHVSESRGPLLLQDKVVKKRRNEQRQHINKRHLKSPFENEQPLYLLQWRPFVILWCRFCWAKRTI